MVVELHVPLSYRKHYQPPEASRELLQNWRDGIVKSHGKDFKVAREVNRSDGPRRAVVLYRASCTLPQGNMEKCVGYIRFCEATGSVDLVNRDASLQKGDFCLGCSSKREDDSQVGSHGDGLMIAITGFLRQGYNVTCRSSNLQWDFFSSKGNVAYRTSPPTTSEQPRVLPPPFVAQPDGDVQFLIGGGSHPVTRDEFHRWAEMALFLTSDDYGITSSDTGAMLTSSKFSGKAYCRGLLMGRNSREDLPFRFGYDFPTKPTIERVPFSSTGDEANAILAIRLLHPEKWEPQEIHWLLFPYAGEPCRHYADGAWNLISHLGNDARKKIRESIPQDLRLDGDSKKRNRESNCDGDNRGGSGGSASSPAPKRQREAI